MRGIRRWMGLALALLLVQPAASLRAQSGASRARALFESARAAQAAGDLDTAAAGYAAAAAADPALAEAFANLGLVEFARHRYAASADALARAAALRPGMRGVALYLGIDKARLHQPRQAVPLLRAAVRQEPGNKEARTSLAGALWDTGQTEEALLALREAAAHFPADPDVLFALTEAYDKAAAEEAAAVLRTATGTALSDRMYAALYVQQRDWAKAETHLRRALRRDPAQPAARVELAGLLLRANKTEEADRAAADALALNPHSAAAMAIRAEALLLGGSDDQALALAQTALATDRAAALQALGLPPAVGGGGAGADAVRSSCAAALARFAAAGTSQDEAHTALRAALLTLADDPAAPDAAGSLGLAGDAAGRAAETRLVRAIAAHPQDMAALYELALVRRRISVALVEQLTQAAPGSWREHALLGRLYMSQEEDDKARDEFRAVAQAQPQLPGIHFWLGHLAWKHGYDDEAMSEFAQQLALDPDHAETHGELGAVLVSLGRDAEAVPHLETALRIKPDLWPAYVQLGRAYARLNEPARAEAVLRRALEHDDDGAVHYQLGLALRAEGKTAQAVSAFAQVRAIKAERMAAPADAPEGALQP